MIWARRCSIMSASKRGWVSASRSSSKPSSRLADSTRKAAAQPVERGAEAERRRRHPPGAAGRPGGERSRAVGQQRGHEVGDARLAGGIRRRAAGEGEGRAPPPARSCPATSQALMPSGVVTALMSTAPAAAGSHERRDDQRGKRRAATASPACLPAASASTSPGPSARQTWRAAAITSAGVTAAMRCGQASMSATVPPMPSAAP